LPYEPVSAFKDEVRHPGRLAQGNTAI